MSQSTLLRSTRRVVGKAMISAVAVFAPLGGMAADWNETHVKNPNWPPHAKFPNGQTLAFAFELAGLSLWQLWRPSTRPRSALRWGTLFASLYWAAQAPAILLPGAALTDPEFSGQERRVAGIPANQLTMQAVVLWPLLAAGYALAADRATDR
ncbi:DUF6640 family protein [Amycolatopsis sp. cmx-8-4]|uniref:DUF6640 family protein n=1 Tax=Amycolatopsis sp. cmx-8-4 TaxID=2790947 RepID=UPI003978B990